MAEALIHPDDAKSRFDCGSPVFKALLCEVENAIYSLPTVKRNTL